MHDKRLKALMEKRDEIIEKMNNLTAAAVDENGEERALTEEEQTQFNEMEKQAENLNKSIQAEERARDLELSQNSSAEKDGKQEEELRAEERAAAEEKAFADFLRGNVSESRADVNMTSAGGSATIPASIAQKIITKVYDICPIANMATRYNVKGTLTIPYYPADSATDITMAYASEFTALESTAGSFSSITLQGFLAGVLTKVSKSLINNDQFDIVGFVVNHMAENVARWLEKELLVGTSGAITGLSTASQVVTAASATAITTDELIELQDMVKDAFQPNACWIMSPATRTAIRKLKDGQNNYILEHNFTDGLATDRLLGKKVYVSDNMPAMASGNAAIYYGDMSGLALKVSEDLGIEVLRERFATEHAVGVVGYMECDAKVENDQKIAVLQMAS